MTFLLVNFAVKNATVFFPFLLSRTGLTISVSLLPVSDAVQCNRPCSAVQPLLQCTASVLAVHCIFPLQSLLCLLAYCRAGSRELRVGIICHADG